MKKFKSLALLSLAFALLLVGPGTLLASGGTPSTGGQVTLTIWGRDLLDGTPDHAYVTALIENFQAANPDIVVDYVPLGDPGLMDKTKIAMATGDLPDIFQSWGGSVMGGYADAGRLLDLTADLASIPGSAAASQAMTWKGKTYGVAPFFAVAGLYVNEGIFQRLGLQVPTTVAEFEAVADRLLAAGIQPMASGAKDKWPPLHTYMYLVNRYGGDAFQRAQARQIAFNSEPFIQGARKFQEWVQKGYFGRTPLGEDYATAQTLMATGEAAMQLTGSWMNGQFSSAEFTDQKFGFYPFPVIPGAPGTAADMMGMTDIGWAATVAAADKKDAVLRFMKYAMSVDATSHEPGRISSVPGTPAPSALTGQASSLFAKAKSITFWWDQDLPPNVTSPLNDTIQTFFIPGTNVAAELGKFEALVVEHMGAVK